MDPRHLAYLAEIIDLGSMSRASQRLSVAQPTLSRIVKHIEDIVGSPVGEGHGHRANPDIMG